jgi:uncharacterized protein (DUF2236 family)
MLGIKSYLGWKIDFLHPEGEPAFAGPDSVSWRVFKNPIALGVGGIAAVLLEFADARIRSGVWDHSTFRTDPVGRSRRTGIAAMVGVYGPQSAARRVIQGVTNMHAKVSGETPTGEPYRALDGELLDWVSATASYGFLTAYDRFVKRVSEADKTRFYAEGDAVARLYGVQHPLTCEADFDAMLDTLLPRFEPHPINTEFLDIMKSGRAAKGVPKGLQSAIVHAAVAILPPEVRTRLELGPEYDLSPRGERVVRFLGTLAERIPAAASPAGQACVRLGLSATFLWKSPEKQASILQTTQVGLAASPAH